jgi:hypothetical protein
MSDRKTIEISSDVYDRLIEKKGENTWDEYLGKMFAASYGELAYLDATTLDDFAGESDEPVVGTIESASDGEVELMFELSDEAPVAFATIPELPEDEQITIKLDKGDLIED